MGDERKALTESLRVDFDWLETRGWPCAETKCYVSRLHREIAALRSQSAADEDGDCTICGLAMPDTRETLEPHECPLGFRSPLNPPASAPEQPERPSCERDDCWLNGRCCHPDDCPCERRQAQRRFAIEPYIGMRKGMPDRRKAQRGAAAASDEGILPPVKSENSGTQSARDGFVLVPREPTEAMIKNGLKEWRTSANNGEDEVHTIYCAMIAAAPSENGHGRP